MLALDADSLILCHLITDSIGATRLSSKLLISCLPCGLNRQLEEKDDKLGLFHAPVSKRVWECRIAGSNPVLWIGRSTEPLAQPVLTAPGILDLQEQFHGRICVLLVGFNALIIEA